jgi:phosphate:Na+ symporter
MDTFKIIYTLLGGLGLFFYGMKSMSDSLQAIAGDMIRKIINSLTANRFFAVAIGMVVTMIIQSSSVTTVMVVGFVNAGLMNLTQAIGVIFGSNIGTTVTGWIISIKIGKYGLLLVGLGIFPALFAKTEKWQQIGRVFFGIGLIFVGLNTMSAAFKPLRTNQSFLDAVAYFSGNNYPSFFASTIMGCILTMVIQSSSAMLGITISLAGTGIIGFHTAAALVLGENIGTTITALLASVGASTNAKRAARAHAIFNVLGVLLIYTVLPWYIDFIEHLIPGEANFIDAGGNKPNIAAHIAAFHSVFNVTATLCFIPFLTQLASLVERITPDKDQKEQPHLVLLGNPKDVLPATAIVQAHQELKKFKEILERMYNLTREYVRDKDPRSKVLAKIKDYERITDNIQKEITVFLCYVMEKSLSRPQSLETQALVRIADEFESIADYLERIANYKSRFKKDFTIEGEALKELLDYLDEVWKFFDLTTTGIYENVAHDLELCRSKSDQLHIWSNDMRDKHLDRVSKGEYQPITALTYSDMVVALRKIRAHALNVAQAVESFNNPLA